ncbi:MAG: tetraacyldisaccharide 4'-kinase [Gammaproteobacteria bacterium]|nr:tetraacyldisaccharide 4'-kinase [Gammaproteobacteria bacterium]MDH5801303.1 tetraacyldisaccharide 4'-kinase [Gammaproteobacteria bacterium]
MNRLVDCWYGKTCIISWLLLPLSLLFATLAGLRRTLYGLGVLKSQSLPVPVIVVGNITVGGTGKTPLVIALVKRLQQSGFKPGIISRGYGGNSRQWPLAVSADSDPNEAGDEPVLLAMRTQCPVVVGPNRVEDGKRLLQQFDCDVLLCDDGLQHYALKRDVEIAVTDADRRFGNGWLLPAGPLREPVSRLKTVDFVVSNGDGKTAGCEEFSMNLVYDHVYRLDDSRVTKPVVELKDRTVNAVAGIGNPKRFFQLLERNKIKVTPRSFADHHQYSKEDLVFNDGKWILMTEKDAVKIKSLKHQKGHKFSSEHMWVLPVQAQLDETFYYNLLIKLNERVKNG